MVRAGIEVVYHGVVGSGIIHDVSTHENATCVEGRVREHGLVELVRATAQLHHQGVGSL